MSCTVRSKRGRSFAAVAASILLTYPCGGLQTGKHVLSLTNAGLGSDIHLIDQIDIPFESSRGMNMIEAMPALQDESLSQEPVPSEYRTSESLGQFSLASQPSSMIQVDRTQISSTAESRQVEFLNRMVDSDPSKPQLIQMDAAPSVGALSRERVALVDSVAYSGHSSVDLAGACAEGYVPFQKEAALTVDECWGKCRGNFACTQVHFSESGGTCYLSHGISVRAAESAALATSPNGDVCRSLTPAGVSSLTKEIGLPPFRMLPNNRVYLVSRNKPIRRQLAGSLAECQSACLEADACSFGVWLDTGINSECVLGADASAECPFAATDCLEVCGTESCLLFERNVDNMVRLPSKVSSVDSGTELSTSKSCEARCSASLASENVCVTLCLADERAKCQAGSLAGKFPAVAFSYGSSGDQKCLGLATSTPPRIVKPVNTTLTRSVDVFVSAKLAVVAHTPSDDATVGQIETEPAGQTVPAAVDVLESGDQQSKPKGKGISTGGRSNASLIQAGPTPVEGVQPITLVASEAATSSASRAVLVSRLSKFLAPTDVRPAFSQFLGSCDVFHEGLLAGSGPGVSQFSAQSVDECWKLCESISQNGCSQIQFHLGSNVCTLGDAIATSFSSNPSVVCRSLDYTPATTSHGLSGMLLVSSVGDMKGRSDIWFGGATAPQLVDSLEQCQALCKLADSGASDAVCRYGGFVECASFHSTLCMGVDGSSPDCGLCDRNPSGGICRIPKIVVPDAQGGYQAAASQSDPPTKCIGGQCRWFERGAVGYSLEVATAAHPAVNYLPMSAGLICDSLTYLPAAQGAAGNCFYPVESLWHCQELCSSVNRFNGEGITACVGGLYADMGRGKQCRLARSRTVAGKPCDTDSSCAWFELSGDGRTAGLDQTGFDLVTEARQQSPLPFVLGKGQCQQFRALDAVITNTPSGFQFSPFEDCSRACSFFPQCTSFQLSGSVSGGGQKGCNLLDGKDSDCTFITCALSSALSLPVPSDANTTLCWSKTPSGTVEEGPAAIDMDNVDPGIPGFSVMNARVRKFGWTQVINQKSLVLTPSLEECQSMCRVSDGCVTGTWQACKAIEQHCVSADQPGTPQEVVSTCDACRNVNLSPSQPSSQFPDNLGVCKMASEVQLRTEGCFPEPCYAFEEGSENFYILSMTKSPFLLPDGSVDGLSLSYKGETGGYVKARTLSECENHCGADPSCRYGQYNPRTTGFGECYLTGAEMRVNDGQTHQLKNPKRCVGTCIVFIKLPTKLPASMIGAQ